MYSTCQSQGFVCTIQYLNNHLLCLQPQEVQNEEGEARVLIVSYFTHTHTHTHAP